MRLGDPVVSFYGMPRRVAREGETLKQVVAAVGGSDEFILKSRTQLLEQTLAKRLDVRHVIAVSSGTAAVQLAVDALGFGAGDEVLVPAFGFHSSLTAVIRSGAVPVLVDVTASGVIDPDWAERAITARTKAVVPVHVFALTADMRSLTALARTRSLKVLENSAVAIGFCHAGRQAGTFGHIGVLSAHPYKPLGGVTDGGFVLTDDESLAEAVRMLRNHGQDGVVRFVHHRVGYNARMDEIGAAMLLHRLGRLDDLLARRAEIARRYDAAFGDIEALSLPGGERDRAGCYAYVLASPERDALERHLARHGVETVIYYPLPLHLQPAFAQLGYRRGDFPVAERLCRELLALPLYPQMPDSDVDHVIRSVRSFHE
jgi:dTDP-4-amino-4,6-dideoxygalactose transaminase